MANKVIDTFEIPDELAKKLSDLLTKQTIRERMLLQLVGDTTKYEAMENMLVPITSSIESIKINITKKYVPEKYNSENYMWNYDGYEVDGNKISIIESN